MDLQTEVARAGEARQILDSALFQAAKAAIEERLLQARRSVPIKDTDMHTRLILMDQLWGSLLDYFEQIALSGKMADIQLRQAAERQSLIDQCAAAAGAAPWRLDGPPRLPAWRL